MSPQVSVIMAVLAALVLLAALGTGPRAMAQMLSFADLDGWDADDHGEGDAVAAELQELFADDAPPAAQGEAIASAHAWSPPKLSAVRLIM